MIMQGFFKQVWYGQGSDLETLFNATAYPIANYTLRIKCEPHRVSVGEHVVVTQILLLDPLLHLSLFLKT